MTKPRLPVLPTLSSVLGEAGSGMEEEAALVRPRLPPALPGSALPLRLRVSSLPLPLHVFFASSHLRNTPIVLDRGLSWCLYFNLITCLKTCLQTQTVLGERGQT